MPGCTRIRGGFALRPVQTIRAVDTVSKMTPVFTVDIFDTVNTFTFSLQTLGAITSLTKTKCNNMMVTHHGSVGQNRDLSQFGEPFDH